MRHYTIYTPGRGKHDVIALTACYAVAMLVAVLQTVVITAAYLIGRHCGYWKRVEEEKSARGIR